METRDILTRLKNGEISLEDAEQYFRGQPFEEDLGGEQGYAKLDIHRKLRQGFPEVIFCGGYTGCRRGGADGGVFRQPCGTAV